MSAAYHKIIPALGKLIVIMHLLRNLNPRRKKIVLIDKSDGFGDIILWLPYAELFRKRYPEDKYILKVLVFHHNQELLHYLSCIDKLVVIFPYKGRFSWIFARAMFWLKNPVDILVYTNNTAFISYDLLIPYQQKKANALVHSKIPFSFEDNNPAVIQCDGMTIYEKYQNALKAIGVNELPKPFDYSQIANAAEYPNLPEDYIVICPGASQITRQWEPQKFIMLIDCLLQKNTFKVILVGTTKEKPICQRIKEKVLVSESVFDLCGKTTISQLFSVIGKSKFLISNDTGTAHIGGVLGVTTFIISGGGDYGTYVPYPAEKEGKTVFSIFSNNRLCFGCVWSNKDCNKQDKPAPCISDITVAQVLETIEHTFDPLQ